MPDTVRDFGQYSFKANDDEAGNVWVMFEPAGKCLAAISGALFLNLRPGIDIEQAEALAEHLNALVAEVEHVRVRELEP